MGLTNSCMSDAPAAAVAAPAPEISSPAGGGGSDDLPASVKGFDAYCAASLDPFFAAATKLGGDAEKGGKIVQEAWGELRSFICMANASKQK